MLLDAWCGVGLWHAGRSTYACNQAECEGMLGQEAGPRWMYGGAKASDALLLCQGVVRYFCVSGARRWPLRVVTCNVYGWVRVRAGPMSNYEHLRGKAGLFALCC